MPHTTREVHAFEAHATDADLDDLRARLAAARLPETETVVRAAPGRRRWGQGVPLADLVDVVEYWRTDTTGGRSKHGSTGSASSARPSTVSASIFCIAGLRAKMPRHWS